MDTKEQIDIFADIRRNSETYDSYIIEENLVEGTQSMMVLVAGHK
jgi:hypothetical protein